MWHAIASPFIWMGRNTSDLIKDIKNPAKIKKFIAFVVGMLTQVVATAIVAGTTLALVRILLAAFTGVGIYGTKNITGIEPGAAIPGMEETPEQSMFATDPVPSIVNPIPPTT